VGERTADRRLEAVLAEQARLTENYQRAIGTGREQNAYFRLRDANARVAKYDRIVRGLRGQARI
jgi:hypothetical protein